MRISAIVPIAASLGLVALSNWATAQTVGLPPAGGTQDTTECVGRFVSDGGFSGAVLDLGADGRFELRNGGCTGETRYAGVTRWETGALSLQCETESEDDAPTQPSQHLIGPFVLVRWGQRLYLIENERADEFCDMVNAGSPRLYTALPSANKFLLREGDWRSQPEGGPDVPVAWQHKLLPGPVIGRITAIESDGRASIDLGSADGVQPGMRLALRFAVEADGAVVNGQSGFDYWYLRVLDVQEHSCRTDSFRGGRCPPVGQPVTGRLPLGKALPLTLWRAAGDDPHLSFEPLPPLPGTSQAELDRWTAQIRATLSRGTPIESPQSVGIVDGLTPAFFNALRGLDLADPEDAARALAILDAWMGYQAQNADPGIQLDLDEQAADGSREQLEDRITKIETFVTWWREMSADPRRYSDFQEARRQ